MGNIQVRFLNSAEKDFAYWLPTLLDPRVKSVSSVPAIQVQLFNYFRSAAEQFASDHSIFLPSSSSNTSEREISDPLSLIPPSTLSLSSLSPSSLAMTYLALPECDRNADPLEWWAKHEKAFPPIAAMARFYLCIPATSVPSERIFSKMGRIVTKLRSALHPKNVQAIMYLNQNLKYI